MKVSEIKTEEDLKIFLVDCMGGDKCGLCHIRQLCDDIFDKTTLHNKTKWFLKAIISYNRKKKLEKLLS